jgi:hypothetical protein
MNENKNLLIVLGEWWERRRAAAQEDARPQQPGRLGRVLRWLTPNGGTLLLVAVLILTQHVWARPLASPTAPGPSATTVNYQGRLADSGGAPLDGVFGMSFSLWDAATDGNLVWGPESHAAVPVSEGLFSVGLGSQTSGGIPTSVWNGDRYLEIAVGGETLAPRELIRSVPIAGMALTVPDGAIGADQIADGAVESDDLDLEYGTVCLSSHATVNLPGNWQLADVLGLSLSFSLGRPSQVLIWMDGLARFDDGSSIGEASINLIVDGVNQTGSWHWTDDNMWFGLKGQRLLGLNSGTHSIIARAGSQYAGTMTVHGMGNNKTCINYLVLGEQ